MADFYSDHYTATASSTSQDDPRIKAAPGIAHAKIHYKRGSVTTTAATAAGDVLRFFQLKSSDRLLELRASTVGDAGTSATADFGLHLTDGGAVVDADLFYAGNLDIKAAVAGVDVMKDGAVDDHDRGKQLWEISDEGASSYGSLAAAPSVFDVTATIVAEVAIAGAEIILEAYYTSAGS